MTIADKIRRAKTDLDEAYEAGKKSEYDKSWDIHQQNGARKDYSYAFGGQGWTDETFKPKYDIVPTTVQYLFGYCLITDLKALLKLQNVTLDLSQCTILTYLAYGTHTLLNLPVLDVRNVKNLSYFIFSCGALRTVDKVILSDKGDQTFSTGYSFGSLSALEEIRFEGVIGSGLSFQGSTKLSKESIIDIINHLSNTTSGLTLILSLTAVNNAFTTAEWEALVATKSNWTISLI